MFDYEVYLLEEVRALTLPYVRQHPMYSKVCSKLKCTSFTHKRGILKLQSDGELFNVSLLMEGGEIESEIFYFPLALTVSTTQWTETIQMLRRLFTNLENKVLLNALSGVNVTFLATLVCKGIYSKNNTGTIKVQIMCEEDELMCEELNIPICEIYSNSTLTLNFDVTKRYSQSLIEMATDYNLLLNYLL